MTSPGPPVKLKKYAMALPLGQRPLTSWLDMGVGLSRTERFVPPYNIETIYQGLDETDKALMWLERAFQQRDPQMAFLSVERKWNNLRADPRFEDLLRRMNFE